jgi:hypothetical protein
MPTRIKLLIGELAATVIRVLHPEFDGLDIIRATILKNCSSPDKLVAGPIDFRLCFVRSVYVSVTVYWRFPAPFGHLEMSSQSLEKCPLVITQSKAAAVS